MRAEFDRRVISDDALAFIRACQRRVQCELGGGAALSGAFLAHRLSHDVDLFCLDRPVVRELVQALPSIAEETGAEIRLVRDAGDFARARWEKGGQATEVDIVVERPLEAPVVLEEVRIRALDDLRASKLTCLLSRSEPRDLVDVLFLERAGHRVEADLPRALEKDKGMDPAVVAWLLKQFPVSPLPEMLQSLTSAELARYRDELSERLRTVAFPESK